MSITLPLDHIEALLHGDESDPHRLLGPHPVDDERVAIRLLRPGASKIYLEVRSEVVEATKIHDEGLFVFVTTPLSPTDYGIFHQDGQLAHDPYAFWPSIGPVDEHLFGKGCHYEIYRILGAQLKTHQGVEGCSFAVWAPSARGVSLVADFNRWDGRSYPMRRMGQSGIWELFVPGLQEGEKYKFEVKTASGEVLLKSDPYARAMELRPKTASIVFDFDNYEWNDKEWLDRRVEEKAHPRPMNAYEVYLGSWKHQDGEVMNYRDLAHQLADYCKMMGFTHIELMPVAEHPLDESWGYQVSGYYAITSRYGSPRDFQYFVDHLHSCGIGVIVDWVPGHFPSDAFSRSRFDGTALYEHEDPRQGWHPHWHTYIFNYGRHEVANFLIANALYLFREMHIDGLRVDAVASMLYLDYGREDGEWIPNKDGGRENLHAIEFLKHLNGIIHERHPGVLMIAEESTSFTGVSHPLESGGLGFDLKWNMGWMNDTLSYFSTDSMHRSHQHHRLTFGLIYAFSERFQLVLSHDEVVHGKRSLLSKMPGDMWQQFANLRLLYSYQMCQPGKKLLFMSGEFGQWDEWWCKQEIQWHLLDYPSHAGMQKMVADLNHLYLATPPLWERDFDFSGFQWVDFSDCQNSVISYRRIAQNSQVLCVHNFTPTYHSEYIIYTGPVDKIWPLFNTDATEYGGSGKTEVPVEPVLGRYDEMVGIKFSLAPLATMIFEIDA